VCTICSWLKSLWIKNESKGILILTSHLPVLLNLNYYSFPLFFFRHLDFFEMVRNEDEKELARKFEKVSFCE
jgi:hypothetical protein